MRGSPLIRALVAFAALALLGWPVWRLTRTTGATLQVEQVAAAQPAHMAMAFTTVPRGVSVRHLGKEVWTASAPTAEIEHDLALPWPKEGVELQFQIDWPADAPLSAARVRITDPEGRDHEKSIFSKGPADEVLTFP